MPNPRMAYKRIVSGCSRGCSLNPERLPAGMGELLHRWFEEGCNDKEIRERAWSLYSVKLSNGATSRHRANHLHAADSTSPGSGGDPGTPSERLSDLDVIESIIQTGAQQVRLSNSKVTTDQLLQAISLKHKLTEGSVFDAMYEAMMAGAGEDLSELMDESDDAVRGEDEQAQGGADGPEEGS